MTSHLERLAAALADRYRIERELGAGGMATVYLAEDLKHDRKVAIKVLKPELAAVLGAERFVQEIKTTAALSHPHILPLFDSGTVEGFLFYVMPYIQGETIREKLTRDTQFGVDDAVRITTEVADALDYAHRHGVIHRDIKPENILLHDGRPMVMDFGIALAVSAAAGGRMTETGLSLGTPHYMSPEQATADKDITARSDIYSLASVLYEMLAGQPPHLGGSAQQVIMKIVTDVARPVTELRKTVPPNVAAAISKALEKLPADRFDTAKAFGEALGDQRYTRGVAPPGGSMTAAASNRRRAALAAVAVGLIAGGGLLGRALASKPSVPGPVVRLLIAPPPGTEFDPFTAGTLAISPDGSLLALSAREASGGTRRLYLRPVNRLEAVAIPGTEGGATPFFSADGLSLGFISVSDGRVRKVDVRGGPVTTISTQPASPRLPAAWGDDGNIYFTGADHRLYRVTAAGGQAFPLGDTTSFLQTTTGKVPSTLAFPAVLPGSRRLIVSECAIGVVRASGDCIGSLRLLDPVSGSIGPLAIPGIRAWYSEGHLVVLNGEGALSAVRFDPASGSVRGKLVTLLDGLGSATFRRPQIDVSRTGALVYLDTGGLSRRSIVEVDRAGRERVIVSQPGAYRWVRQSPDGTRILMVADAAQSAGSQLYVYDKRSATMSQLTFVGANQRPSWSPDGNRIVFSSARDSVTDIWVVLADGSALPTPIARGKDVVQQTATFWTRDGQWIIIDGLADQGGSAGADDIFALPANGQGSLRPLVATPANEQDGEVSPDGRWLAYTSEDAGFPQVYVQPFLRPGGRTLISVGPAVEPAWLSPNELTYTSMTTDSLVLARLTFGTSINVTRTGLLDASRYVQGLSAWREYDVSRDGQHFIFSRPLTSVRAADVIVVLNWLTEVRAALASRQTGR